MINQSLILIVSPAQAQICEHRMFFFTENETGAEVMFSIKAIRSEVVSYKVWF